jgi:hypothetical protein
MQPSPHFLTVFAEHVASDVREAPPDAWRVPSAAWRTLGTGFDHARYADDPARQNVELKLHLARCWEAASLDEKIRLATWIVSDWGGIRRNNPATILGYVNQADAERPATPFTGISSYSKILAIKDPVRHAVYDARVAASLTAIQLLLLHDGKLASDQLLAFAIPMGRNQTINQFIGTFVPRRAELGFATVPPDMIYRTYLDLLGATSKSTNKPILEIEMFLFGHANRLCTKALQLVARRAAS